MKTCFNTITCGAEKPLEVTLDLLGKYGYDGVEIEFSRIDDYLTRHSIDGLKQQLKKNNLQVAALMAFPFFAFNEDARNDQLRNIEKWADVGSQLGASTLLCFICDAPPEGMSAADAMEISGKAAQRYGEVSGKYGVKCALEAIGGTSFMRGPRQALAVSGASGSSNIGIMMDTFHYYKSGIPVDEIRSIPREQLLIVHVNDCPDLSLEELADSHRVYTGQGVIPLVDEFRILKNELNYQGFLSIEIFNPAYWADTHENVIRDAKQALDSVLAKL